MGALAAAGAAAGAGRMIRLVVAERNVAMGVHTLCEHGRLYGGTLSTKLVTEDDLQMIWECPVHEETELTSIDLNGLEHTTRLFPGDTMRWTWSLHLGITQPLSSESRRRFGL